MVVDQQATRAQPADHVLVHPPESFSHPGQPPGGRVAREVAERAPERVPKPSLRAPEREGSRAFQSSSTHCASNSSGTDQALNDHVGRILHACRYPDTAFCDRLRARQREPR